MRMQRCVFLAFLVTVAGCDPETPVQETAASEEIQGRIDAHATDPNTHTNLNVAAGQITGEITGGQIADGTIGFEHIETEAVGSDEIADGAIASADIGQSAVGSSQLADDSVITAKIADDAVTGANIADTSVDTNHLVNVSVTAAKIALNTITDAQIATDAVTSAEIDDGTIALADMGNDSVDTNQIVDGAILNAKLDDNAVTTAKIMDGQVQTNDIANANVTTAKLANASVSHLKSGLRFVGEQTDAASGNFDTIVFSFTEDNTDRTITVIGVCESDVAGSEVRLADDDEGNNNDATCPDTDLMGPPAFFSLTVNANDANGDAVQLLINAGANNGTVRWTILNVTST